MYLLERAREILSNDVNEEINDIHISTVYNGEGYEITGWPDIECEDMVLPPKERVEIESGSEFEEEVDGVFSEVVSVDGAEVSSIDLAYTPEIDDEYKTDFYTSEEADARLFIGVTSEVLTNEERLEDIVFELLEDDVDSVLSFDYLFSDFRIVELSTLRGKIMTDSPHNYYDVESVEEYVNKSNKDVTLEQDLYELFYKFSLDERNSINGELPDSVIDEVEEMMWDFVEESLTVDGEYRIEGEVIGRNSEYDTEEVMKYYVNVPIVGDDIGTVR